MTQFSDLIHRHGAFGFFKILWGRFFPLERLWYWASLTLGKGYFGEYLSARQGVSKRHRYLEQTVGYLRRESKLTSPQLLEVGSWAGASAIVFAKALIREFGSGHLTCIDPWNDFYGSKPESGGFFDLSQKRRHRAALRSGKVFDLFRHNLRVAGVSGMVSFHQTKFETWDADQQFDLIYIDGDHRYEAVKQHLKKADGLLKVGGILCGDDLEVEYPDVDTKVCEDYLTEQFIYEGKIAKRHFHPGVTKAVYECLGRVSCYDGFWLMQKTGPGQYRHVTL